MTTAGAGFIKRGATADTYTIDTTSYYSGTVGDGALTLSINATAAATNNTITIGTGTGFSANVVADKTYDIKVGPALTALAAIMTTAGAGFIKRGAAADTYTIDTSTYLTSYIDTNTTYDHLAVTTTGGALLRLHGSDSTNDDVKFVSDGGTTVSFVDANNIKISSTAVGDGALTIATKTAGLTNTDVTLELSGAYSANTSTDRTVKAIVGPALTGLAAIMTGITPVGFVKKTGEDAYTIDTSTYLTSSTGVTSFSAGSTGLTPNTATVGAITLGGTLAIGSGGTNITTYTSGDILYASAANVLSKLAKGSDGQVLKLASGLPTWGTDIDTQVSVANDESTTGQTYLLFTSQTSGTLTATKVATTNLSFLPNSGKILLAGTVGNASVGIERNNLGDITFASKTLPGGAGNSSGIYAAGYTVAAANNTGGALYLYGGQSIGTDLVGGDVIVIPGFGAGTGGSGAFRIKTAGPAVTGTTQIAGGDKFVISNVGDITTGVWKGTSIGTAYTDAKIVSVSGTAPVTASTSSGAVTISMAAATASVDGYMTSTFASKLNGIAASATANAGTVTSVSVTAPLAVATGTTTPALSITQASASVSGYLSSGDWNTFNGKAASDTNYYPTTYAWTAGTTSGPTASLSGSGMTAVSFDAIPTASASASGIVTTGTQTFAGVKTFPGLVSTAALSVTNNVSVGLTTPGTWSAGKAIELTQIGNSIWSNGNNISMLQGTYFNTTWKYSSGNAATRYTQSSGQHIFAVSTDATGYAADSNTTFATVMAISSTGVAVTGAITSTGDITAFFTSDSRLKTNVVKIDNALDKVNSIDGVTFNWNDLAEGKDKTQREAGVLAQQIQAVLPEVVTERDTGYLAVRYEKLVPLLIEAIKELTTKVADLQNQINNK